jgi:hypothetical protein
MLSFTYLIINKSAPNKSLLSIRYRIALRWVSGHLYLCQASCAAYASFGTFQVWHAGQRHRHDASVSGSVALTGQCIMPSFTFPWRVLFHRLQVCSQFQFLVSRCFPLVRRAGAAFRNNSVPATTSAPTTNPKSRRAQALWAFLRCHKSLLRWGDGLRTEAANTCPKTDTALMFVPIRETESHRGSRCCQGVDVATVVTTNAEAIIEAGVAAARVNKQCYDG